MAINHDPSNEDFKMRVKAYIMFFRQIGVEEAAKYCTHQDATIAGLTSNNEAFAKAYRESLDNVLLGELEAAGNKVGMTIYNICHRNAGIAIQWYDKAKQGRSNNWKDGLFVDRYYPTLKEAIEGELIRVRK